jgi:hypothetical protein
MIMAFESRVLLLAQRAPEDGSGGSGERPAAGPGAARVRLNLDVSPEIASFLDTLAQENATTKTDVMRRAIALLKIAHDAKKRNRTMGFVASARDDVLETKVVGIL